MTTVPLPLHGCSAFRWIDPESFSLHHPRASTDRKSQFGRRISTCAHGARERERERDERHRVWLGLPPESSLAIRISPKKKSSREKNTRPAKFPQLRKFSACPKLKAQPSANTPRT